MDPNLPTYVPPSPPWRTSPPPTEDPCSSCPRLLPGWALALLIILLLVVAISVGLNIMFVLRRRRLQRDLAIQAHMDLQKSSFMRKTNGNGVSQPNGSDKQPMLRTKTIALKKSRIEIPRENIGISVSLRSIGDGQFGHVWKGETRGLTVNDGHVIPVAARELPDSLTRDDVLDHLTPIWRLKTHENIVQVYGCCLETEPSYILTEYVPNGSLFTYLRTNGGITRTSIYANIVETLEDDHQITLKQQFMFAFDVANGMEYLASKQVIHGSLCAHNILLSQDKRCKVADFGLTALSDLAKVTKDSIYERWMSLERLSNGLCSPHDDIWAYGVLVWEIMTYGRRPYSELGKENLIETLASGYRLRVPERCDEMTSGLMKSCWAEKESERLTFEQIKTQLGDKVEEEADYFALGNNMDSYYACVDVIER
ncbi:tyrosine kinase receptor Cad96Ca-like [Lytechinus pictus]|uniref:tyrosine kinase receptor Cad96Ca-like n=1 Tax=Lytechinus pictus TaxID=7653 RepID=UPI0030B9B7C1